jgi:transcription antitermination factor NusG
MFMALTITTKSFETDFNPGLAPDAKPWHAIRVRSRFEQTTSSLLRDKGFEQFLPLYRSRRRWSDRLKELDLPLFPGYVFCRFDPSSPLRVLTTPGVVHIVSAGRAPVPVDKHEISALQDMCCSGLPLQPWPYLDVGRRVSVERGPLAGTEGAIIEMKGRYRLVVSISMLQRSVAAEIDRDWIRPVL